MRVAMAYDKHYTLGRLAKDLYNHDKDTYERDFVRRKNLLRVLILFCVVGLFILALMMKRNLDSIVFMGSSSENSVIYVMCGASLFAFWWLCLSTLANHNKSKKEFPNIYEYDDVNTIIKTLDKLYEEENPPGFPYLYHCFKQLEYLYKLEEDETSVKMHIVPDTGDTVLTIENQDNTAKKEELKLMHEAYDVKMITIKNNPKVIIRPNFSYFRREMLNH